MKNTTAISLILCMLTLLSAAQEKPKYKNADIPARERIVDLMTRMTLEEKVGQMTQYHLNDISGIEKVLEDVREGKVSSFVNNVIEFYPPKVRNRLQRSAVEESRLGIPLIFSHDVIHGCKTIFPISLAQSCTWDPGLVEKGAAISAREAAASGIDWTNGPMVDVARDPRWGRIAEGYGEDTYLNSIFGAAMVRGFQGDDPADKDRVAACMKHYTGYGAAAGGRDYQFTGLSERALRETYLPPFKAGIDEDALVVMTAFNDIDGVPATANEFILTRVLREEWGFDGFTISDWDAVEQLISHGYARDSMDAAIKAVKAGTDMEMKSNTYKFLIPAVRQGLIPETLIDRAVERILTVKFRIGLFENPYVDEERVKTAYLQDDALELSREIAGKSMVLLENREDVLPVDFRYSSVCVTGPFAGEDNLMGWWRSMGDSGDVVTPVDGLMENAPAPLQITREITSGTEAVIVCVGEKYDQFGEDHSRSDIRLPFDQEEIIDSLARFELPLIVIVFNGRPLDLTNVVKKAHAVVLAWHPGTQAGNALADVLYGTVNPSGRLTAGFPRSAGQIPVNYNHRSSGRPYSDTYIDASSEPLYPFGYGLSYTDFEYSQLKVVPEKAEFGDPVEVSAIITNTGDRTGRETVQLYIRDVVGSLTQPVKSLRQFKGIELGPGQSEKVTFTLGPEDLEILNSKMEWEVEPGEFVVWVGTNSVQGLKSSFEVLDAPAK